MYTSSLSDKSSGARTGSPIRHAAWVLLPLCAIVLAGCNEGTPDPATEATDPAKAPRGGDMVSTQMRAGQRATQAVNKANAVREAQMKELE